MIELTMQTEGKSLIERRRGHDDWDNIVDITQEFRVG